MQIKSHWSGPELITDKYKISVWMTCQTADQISDSYKTQRIKKSHLYQLKNVHNSEIIGLGNLVLAHLAYMPMSLCNHALSVHRSVVIGFGVSAQLSQ